MMTNFTVESFTFPTRTVIYSISRVSTDISQNFKTKRFKILCRRCCSKFFNFSSNFTRSGRLSMFAIGTVNYSFENAILLAMNDGLDQLDNGYFWLCWACPVLQFMNPYHKWKHKSANSFFAVTRFSFKAKNNHCPVDLIRHSLLEELHVAFGLGLVLSSGIFWLRLKFMRRLRLRLNDVILIP
jgi:hypothetical protein